MIQIPGYTIERELGHGGMATVYLAQQDFTQRQVAIKLMSTALAADPSFSERFLKEATCAHLSHPNIVTVHDAGEVDKHNYIVMEYAPGGDLAQAIRRGITIYDSIKVMKQMAAALGYAHERGYVHRDVKPENILFRADGSAVLVDFGIAKASTSETKMTAVGMAIGSPHYMSPEQARGKELDGRSDLYSLGIVLYEMLTGKKPFDAEDTYAIGYKHIHEAVPQLPPEAAKLQPVLNKLMAKDPADRFASATELEEALAHLDGQGSGTMVMDALPDQTADKGKAVRYAAAGGLLALLLLGGGYLYLQQAPDTHHVQGDTQVASQPPQPASAEAEQPQATAETSIDQAAAQDSQAEQRRQAAEQALREERQRLEEEKRRIAEEARQASERAAQEQKITLLLSQAKLFLNNKALTQPKGANAFETYQQVVALSPGHPEAIAGLHEIAQSYLLLAQAHRDKGDIDGALGFTERGLSVEEANPELLALRNELQASRDERFDSIQQRLDAADRYLAAGPEQFPRAYALYREVLKQDRRNAGAERGISSLEKQVIAAFDQRINAQDLDGAAQQLQLARGYLPASSVPVVTMNVRLTDARERLAGEQRRRAIEEDTRRLEQKRLALMEGMRAPPPPPSRLKLAGKPPKIALLVDFDAGNSRDFTTADLENKLNESMTGLLRELTRNTAQILFVDDDWRSQRMRFEGTEAEVSREVCREQGVSYVFGALMDRTFGGPRDADLVLYDCFEQKRYHRSHPTQKGRRIEQVRKEAEAFLRG